MLPRILFDGWSGKDWMKMMQRVVKTKEEARDIARIIWNTLEDYEMDGIVLEMWSQLGGQAKPEAIKLIK